MDHIEVERALVRKAVEEEMSEDLGAFAGRYSSKNLNFQSITHKTVQDWMRAMNEQALDGVRAHVVHDTVYLVKT